MPASTGDWKIALANACIGPHEEAIDPELLLIASRPAGQQRRGRARSRLILALLPGAVHVIFSRPRTDAFGLFT
jgi:hypothetical protein